MEQPINILIVDDEPKNLTVLETILDDPAYRLVRAESADQALLALVVEEFALLILDIRMPGMTGFELARMIKERKKTARVPIIFLTAYYNEDQHVLAGYDTGAVDYLHKPVNSAILRSKVAVFAELHRKSREIGLANRALLGEVTERRRTEERLRELNETLEQRVAERTQALREADRRKNEFLATLAHELRNPLAPIRNGLAVMRSVEPDPHPMIRRMRDMAERQVAHMVRLIDDLLDVSRIGQGKIVLRREPVDLADVIRMAIETSGPLIEKGGHHLEVELPDNPVWLMADPTRLTQALANVLNNAAKYTPPGGRISLSAFAEENNVVVRVRDTGIGIPSEALPRVFDLFTQVSRELDRSSAGLGIGLALVKSLVELHGGRVEAASEGPGKGSEFVLRLTRADSPAAVSENAERTQTGTQVQRKVLVVEDHVDAAESLRLLLELAGHEVAVAHDGLQGIEMARQFKPDVVLCDIGLPGLSGYEVARMLRSDPVMASLRLVSLSGYGQDADRQRAKEAGFDEAVVKPVDFEQLHHIMSK